MRRSSTEGGQCPCVVRVGTARHGSGVAQVPCTGWIAPLGSFDFWWFATMLQCGGAWRWRFCCGGGGVMSPLTLPFFWLFLSVAFLLCVLVSFGGRLFWGGT